MCSRTFSKKPWVSTFAHVAIAAFLSACSTSALIQKNDPAFSEAQQRLERTTKTVNELKPLSFERTLFLQAESFYRYRYMPPSRGTEAYFAEAAAAFTDFPGFQSLAGSFDLLDLRYRAPDSAVQLWESLLTHYPQTTLKPFTLYRLGWAYRSTGAKGLPRTLPDTAFDELIKDQPDSKLAALAKEAKAVPWKSKEIATARSLIPGFGQMYVGETNSGLIRLGVAITALAAIMVPIYTAAHRKDALTWKLTGHSLPLALAA